MFEDTSQQSPALPLQPQASSGPAGGPINSDPTSSKLDDLLHLRNFSSLPLRGNVGDIVCVGAALYLCTAANTWTKIGTSTPIYGGRIASNAAAAFFPSGWSVAHTGTGVYTITHNLGHKNYALVVTPDVSGEAYCIFGFAVLDNNTIQVWFNNPDASFGFQNQDFGFILTTQANP